MLIYSLMCSCQSGADVTAKNDEDTTALHVAAMWSEDVRIVTLLHAYGADLMAKDHYGRTPLVVAAGDASVDVVRELLRYMRGQGLDEVDSEGRTAVWWAAKRNEADMLRSLLLEGAAFAISDDEEIAPRAVAKDKCQEVFKVRSHPCTCVPCTCVRCLGCMLHMGGGEPRCLCLIALQRYFVMSSQ